MATQHELISLLRYYLWSSQMLLHLRQYASRGELDKTFMSTDYVFLQLYMSLWCASLYVVIEGWKQLKLHDSVIDDLLTSPNLARLEQFRHGVFHYQRAVFHKKLKALSESTGIGEWIMKIHEELGRCIPAMLDE